MFYYIVYVCVSIVPCNAHRLSVYVTIWGYIKVLLLVLFVLLDLFQLQFGVGATLPSCYRKVDLRPWRRDLKIWILGQRPLPGLAPEVGGGVDMTTFCYICWCFAVNVGPHHFQQAGIAWNYLESTWFSLRNWSDRWLCQVGVTSPTPAVPEKEARPL